MKKWGSYAGLKNVILILQLAHNAKAWLCSGSVQALFSVIEHNGNVMPIDPLGIAEHEGTT